MLIGINKIDFDGRVIDGPAGRHMMEAKVMALLKVLTDRRQEVLSREDLITAVWGVSYGGDERLSRAISLLRKALGDTRGNHTHIQTISKQGYRLIAPITEGATVGERVEDVQILPPVDETAKDPVISAPQAAATPAPISAADNSLSTIDAAPIVTPKYSLKLWLGSLAATLIGVAVIGFGYMALRPSGYISVQAGMEEGLGHIENFTAKNAIEDAQDIFGLILADDPDHAAARAGLALALMREYTHLERDPSILQRAKATAEAALREDEYLALANIAVGWAAEYNGELERAHSLYDKADILDPENELTFEGRARTFFKQDNKDAARNTLERAISIHPSNANFHTYLGELLLGTSEPEKAENILRKAIELSPNNPRTYAQFAQALHIQDKTSESIQTIQEGLKINDTALLYSNLGAYLFFQGQYDMATKAFERTIQLDGDSHDYLYWSNLADAYRWTTGRKNEAAPAYTRALQLLQSQLDKLPNSKDLNSRAALYNAKLGDLEAAQEALSIIGEPNDLSAVQYYRLTVTYEILANRAQALMLLGRAIYSGYPLAEVKNDPELSALRQDPAYHRLLTQPNLQQKEDDL